MMSSIRLRYCEEKFDDIKIVRSFIITSLHILKFVPYLKKQKMKKLILWAAVLGMSISSTIAQVPAKPATAPAKPQMEKAAQKPAAPVAVKSTTTASKATPMKADGSPDKRFKKNKHVKKDGSPDKRFSEHKDPKTKPAVTK